VASSLNSNIAGITLGISPGTLDVVGGYTMRLANGAKYTGVYHFRCK
jgi:hypothetical protein